MPDLDLGIIALAVSTVLFIGVTVKELVKVYKNAREYVDDLQKYADAIRNGENPPPPH